MQTILKRGTLVLWAGFTIACSLAACGDSNEDGTSHDAGPDTSKDARNDRDLPPPDGGKDGNGDAGEDEDAHDASDAPDDADGAALADADAATDGANDDADDGSTDAGPDTGDETDAGDSGADAPEDTGAPDAPGDAAEEPDASEDAAVDAAPDAVADAPVDAPIDAPIGVCTSNADCTGGKFCKKAEGDCKGTGKCATKPDPTTCGFGIDMCGCDGRTYGNECYANAAGTNIDTGSVCP